eukprot:2481583-Rhodomonas_salina.3
MLSPKVLCEEIELSCNDMRHRHMMWAVESLGCSSREAMPTWDVDGVGRDSVGCHDDGHALSPCRSRSLTRDNVRQPRVPA